MNNINKTNVKPSTNKLTIPKLSQVLYKIHIGVMGDEKCGKTTLINTFLSKTFTDQKQSTHLVTQKIIMYIENTPIECIISEINIAKNQNDQVIKNYIKHIDVFFLCHEISENDEKFNEEMIKRYISYISSLKETKEYLIYVVGCKLDLKVTELKLKTAYIIDNNQRFTSYGQRIKTFVETNPVKKFYLTSSLLNYNIKELFEDAILSFGYKEYHKIKSKDNEPSNTRRTNFDEEDFYEHCNIF